ncbi:oncoprotein-induced transcript 3 protein-like [Diadema setosum]|uniref:oncoprotein-induced transcript 3 protein-like n=1 Tax=Diadema setosum TaxID=31175 RepID=UPI003B3A09AF
MTVLFDKNLLRAGTDEGDIHFKDETCMAYDHDSHNYALSTTYDSCQTEMEAIGRYVVFSNVVTYNSQQPIPGTNITRDHALQISVRCELDRRQVLGESFLPITGKISLSEVGYGNFSLSLDRYTDQTFNEVVDDDQAEVGLGDPLYFAVNLMSVGGLAVFIEKCWATPTSYPNNRNNYTFLSDGCAEDPTLQILDHSSDPSFKPFIIDAFIFIGENPEVFVHCEVLVCDSDDPNSRCAQGCQSRVRRSGRQRRGTRSAPHLISNGPLSLSRAHANSENVDQMSSSNSFDIQTMGMAVGVAIGAVVVFVCLAVVMAIGFIFLRTFRRGDHRGYRRINVSEDSED